MNLYDRVFKHLLKGIETSLKRNKDLKTYMEESFDKQGEDFRELENSFDALKESSWGLNEDELNQLMDGKIEASFDGQLDDRLNNGLDQVFDERFDERLSSAWATEKISEAVTELIDPRLTGENGVSFVDGLDGRFDELFDKRLRHGATTEEFYDYCLNNELKDAQERLYNEQQELLEEQKNLCSRIEQLSNKVDGAPSTGKQLDACVLEELVINTLIKYGVDLDVKGGE
tara:strand:+ start:1141 stop:1830 length:690 start_codon:yes stop_codon:yes gene_type:complete